MANGAKSGASNHPLPTTGGAGLWDSILTRPARLGLYILISTPVAILLGLLLGRWLLPVVQTCLVFPVFYGLVARKRLGRAALAMTGWAALTAWLVIYLTIQAPEYLGDRILMGESYRREMFTWVATGVGKEGDISQFLPQHVLHFVLFALLTSATGGFLGLVMGSVLMNYMSFYVGSLLLQSQEFNSVALLAWPPWAATRVVAYIVTATGLAALVYDRVGLCSIDLAGVKRALVAGGLLLLLDVLLKWTLAPVWQPWLLRLVGW